MKEAWFDPFEKATGIKVEMRLQHGMMDALAKMKASKDNIGVDVWVTGLVPTMLADEGFGEWGFAALVDVDGRRLLFDTGANEDTVQRNVRALGIDLTTVDTVILSHNHADHTTGLTPLRRQLASTAPKALSTLYAGKGLFWPRLAADGKVDDRTARMRRDYEASGGRVVDVTAPTEVAGRRSEIRAPT